MSLGPVLDTPALLTENVQLVCSSPLPDGRRSFSRSTIAYVRFILLLSWFAELTWVIAAEMVTWMPISSPFVRFLYCFALLDRRLSSATRFDMPTASWTTHWGSRLESTSSSSKLHWCLMKSSHSMLFYNIGQTRSRRRRLLSSSWLHMREYSYDLHTHVR